MIKIGDDVLSIWGEGVIRKVFAYSDGSICYQVRLIKKSLIEHEFVIVSDTNIEMLKIEAFDIEI